MRSFLSWVAILCVAIITVHAADNRAHDREQIIQLERDWVRAWVTMDAAANDRILADDFLGTGPDGKRATKADLMAELKSGEAPLASNRLNEDDLTIRFYGDTAVVNGSESWKQKDGKSGRYIWTDIFVKRNGKWQVVASQDLEVDDK
jgi:ketosteroid isomerase-like protein